VFIKTFTILNTLHCLKLPGALNLTPFGFTRQVAEPSWAKGYEGEFAEQIEIHRFNWINFCDSTGCSLGAIADH